MARRDLPNRSFAIFSELITTTGFPAKSKDIIGPIAGNCISMQRLMKSDEVVP